jgi:adenylate cyclase
MSGSNASDLAGKLPNRRKLIAVMYADMVGYSRLIGLDDAGTLQRLRSLRREVIDPAIEEHAGHIVQTGGDSLLVVFDSIDGAVRCAILVQQQVPIHDGEQSPDRAVRFRIGINLGDAIADGTDLHGDAVNIAARLPAECPPGGICVSRSVRDHVHGRLDLIFEELGPLGLKNIARPVEAFVVTSAPRPVGRPLGQGTSEALPLPDKPSMAVLAFTNMSGNPEQEYFSDGIADDIITELSRSHSLLVIARNSSFTYKGRAVDMKLIARELGVRYVLEGSVRRSGERIRVIAQLINAETGTHIWAERYDRELSDVFAVQDEITVAVVRAVLPAVSDAELRRILRRPPESLGAWDAYQRGLWHMGRGDPVENARAQHFFGQAIQGDHSFASAHSAMAMAVLLDGIYGKFPQHDDSFRAAGQHASDAVDIDPTDADAQAILALTRFSREGVERGTYVLSALTDCLLHKPNAAWAHGVKGMILVQLDRCSEGRAALLAAEQLNPRDPSAAVFPTHFAISYYYERDYASAVAAAKEVIERYPNDPRAYRWLAAAFGQLGQFSEAREALQQATEVSRDAFLRYVRSRPPWFLPENYEHMMDGLRKAGWQG